MFDSVCKESTFSARANARFGFEYAPNAAGERVNDAHTNQRVRERLIGSRPQFPRVPTVDPNTVHTRRKRARPVRLCARPRTVARGQSGKHVGSSHPGDERALLGSSLPPCVRSMSRTDAACASWARTRRQAVRRTESSTLSISPCGLTKCHREDTVSS